MPEPLDFSRRAQLEELMDGPCSYEELQCCLADLAIVNRLTFAHTHIVRWLDRTLRSRQLSTDTTPLRLLDIGCGYGDMLRRIESWAAARRIPIELVGADINPNAIRAAREATPRVSGIQWVVGDVCTVVETQQADLITSCGVFHHLSDREIVRLLAWADSTAKVGWYITDLHRERTPYRIFELLMRGPWWHRFIRPDGLASIRRSFRHEDWIRLCTEAGLPPGSFHIQSCRPARLSVGSI
jgi:SAM-dependent methyltransferase